jgi:hypothetical protein
MNEHKVNLFLDSGAFSAWTMGVPINIQSYIAFIKKHKDLIKVYANLDVIGLGGKQPNEKTAEKTWENQLTMEESNLHPLPCFHFGEPMEYLDRYVKYYDYIALGVAGNKGSKLIPWMNDCFSNHICDKDGMPKVKVHGFAVTSLKLMLRYPWYSVDSTSWVIISRMGAIMMPRFRKGEWIYDEQSWKVIVSNRNPSMADKDKHIDTMVRAQRKAALDYIEHKGFVLGRSIFRKVSTSHELQKNERWAEPKPKTSKERLLEVVIEPGLSNDYKQRDQMNIIYYTDLEKSMPEWPWAFKSEANYGFFK